MSGKGKYIWSNGIMYEGDFINNEIIGAGKYIWPEENVKFSSYEGDVYKGKRHGLGTFKSGNTPNIYIGEWVQGKRYGKVDKNLNDLIKYLLNLAKIGCL